MWQANVAIVGSRAIVWHMQGLKYAFQPSASYSLTHQRPFVRPPSSPDQRSALSSASAFPLPSSTFDLPHSSQLNHPALASSCRVSHPVRLSFGIRKCIAVVGFGGIADLGDLERVASRADSNFASRSSPTVRPQMSFSAVPLAEAH